MKKFIFAILFGVLILCSSVFGSYFSWKYYTKQKENKAESWQILKIAEDLIEEQKETIENNNAKHNEQEIVFENGIIGILKIPVLNIEAPIKDGTSQEVMRTSIGHFIESDYWNGNVALASHNGGSNAHYFSKISTLNNNDEIEYLTKFGTKKYVVQDIKKIESTDWSMVEKNSKQNENTITLITCINGQPKYRLCVRGKEM